MRKRFVVLFGGLILFGLGTQAPLSAQEVRIGDVATVESDIPFRVMGYGLVVGLNGTGDLSLGTARGGGGHTVRSIVNLLRRFDITIPEEYLRARNVAAVLVTAEISSYARPGSRFTVHVSSIGDARSLEGGVLFTTPLFPDVGSEVVASAQGPLVFSDGDGARFQLQRKTGSAVVPDGGLVEVPLPERGVLGRSIRLILKQPNFVTADKIAAAVQLAFGEGVARVEDAGAVTLVVPDSIDNPSRFVAQVSSLHITEEAKPQILIDSRQGTVVAGGDIRVGPASISVNGISLAVGGEDEGAGEGVLGAVAVRENVSIQDVVNALQVAGAGSRDIAAILRGLRDVGAIKADVIVR